MRVIGVVVLVSVVTVFDIVAVKAACHGEKMLNGWCWPTGTSNIGNYLGFGERNPNYQNRHHLGQDIEANEDDDVYAIADGRVLYARDDVGGYGGLENCTPTHTDSIPGAGIIIEHTTVDGEKFIALYGHLKNVQVGETVDAGQKIAKIRNYTACGTRMDHLHFGIRFPANEDDNRWAGYESNNNYYHFVDPINFLNTHYPYIDFSDDSTVKEIKARIVGNYGWYPPNADCFDAIGWFEILSDRCILRDRTICYEVQGTCPFQAQNE